MRGPGWGDILGLRGSSTKASKSVIYLPALPIRSHLLPTVCMGISLATAMASVQAEPSPAGIWQVEGRDETGTDWKAVLVLEADDKDVYPPRKFKGYFDWEGSNGTGGREYVSAATYDYASRRLAMRGGELEDADPNIRSSLYSVKMTEAADRLVDGTWKGEDVSPGVFSAKRLAEKPGKN